ncbi:MAG TPA: efflux RND transporter periplasmic adaptor subunit, partial [Rhizomicrobium sp.]|nr:efflux RND transporter periplasmic adaptor subunit [Rhizomicrobium sp.]
MTVRPRAATALVFLGVLASGVLALLLAGCSGKSETTAQRQPPPPTVGVVTVQQRDVPTYGDWVASLDGFVNANIQPQVSGYLLRQIYREGSFVRKDQVLFEIDPRPFQAALDQARGQLAQARGQLAQARGQLAQSQAQLQLTEINVNRDQPLVQARAVPKSQLDTDVQAREQNKALVQTAQASIQTAQAAIQAAEAAVETASLNLGFTKVRSLIDGIAGIASTQIGNLVGQTTVLTTVSQVNPIKVYFPISEQEYLRLSGRIHGNAPDLLRATSRVPLEMTLANGDKYARQGRIIFADRQVDTQTGTIRMVGQFSNPGNILRPGQFARIRAMTGYNRGALLVPQRAVTEVQGRYQVAVVGPDNKVAIHNVQAGERVDDMWIISSGLAANDRVVSEGTSKVRDGVVVNPQ